MGKFGSSSKQRWTEIPMPILLTERVRLYVCCMYFVVFLVLNVKTDRVVKEKQRSNNNNRINANFWLYELWSVWLFENEMNRTLFNCFIWYIFTLWETQTDTCHWLNDWNQISWKKKFKPTKHHTLIPHTSEFNTKIWLFNENSKKKLTKSFTKQ